MTTTHNIDPETGGRLLDCGHVGRWASVCRYDRCAAKQCPECTATCMGCGRTLCRRHQMVVDDGRQVFCPADVRGYLATKLALRLLGRS